MNSNYNIVDASGKALLNMETYNLNSSYKGNVHSHHYLEISYIKSGNGSYLIDDKLYHLSSGDIVILSNVETHVLIVSEKSSLINQVIHFEPRFIWSQMDNSFDSRYLDIFFNRSRAFNNCLSHTKEVTSKIGELFSEIEEEFLNKNNGYDLMIKVNLLNILVLILRQYDFKPSNTNIISPYNTNCINEILDYIDFNLHNEISLKDLADIAHMNISYFSTFFKKYNGIGPAKYIMSKRIEKALDYLKFSDKNITEISTLCGFTNMTSFYNAFKKLNGTSPLDYRKKYINSLTNG